MVNEGIIVEWRIERIGNGWLVRVWINGATREIFFFDARDEVLAFLETNLD